MKRSQTKCITLLLTLLFSYKIGFCQSAGSTFDNTRPTTVVPPSPQAASLLKDINIPVNNFTGTAQVNIPLYSIRIGSIEMPIGLKYGSNGIKVEEESGWTGLGWDLQNTGGTIGRSLIGSADERTDFTNGGAGYRLSANGLGMPAPSNSTSATAIWASGLTACNLQKLAEGKAYNLMPDQYFMNFNGNSARLFFDKDGNPFISPYKAWKIKGNEANGFIVTTEDGMIYEFMLAEYTASSITSSQDVADPPSAKTAWHLTRIITPNHTDTLLFNYTSASYSFDAKNPEQSYQQVVPAQGSPYGVTPSPSTSSTTLLNQSVGGYLLSSIVSKNQRVEFDANMNRLDIPDNTYGMPYKLDSIRIYRTAIAAADILLEKIVFNYGYFSSGSSSPNAVAKRLKLLSLTLTDPTNTLGQIYKFDYYTGGASGGDLPDKNSKAQDYWGYYNGASNTTLIPTFTGIYGDTYPGANRLANPMYANIGMLKQIQYPTGGYTLFDYEAHDYPTDPVAQGGMSTVTQMIGAHATYPVTLSQSKQFSIPFGQYVSVTSNIVQRNGSDGDSHAYIMDSNGNVVYQPNYGTQTGTQYLNTGTYTLYAYCTYATEHASIGVTYAVYSSSISPTYTFYGGGTRIKRIIQTDSINPPVVKVFHYRLPDSTSSGVSFSKGFIYGDIQYSPIITAYGKQGDFSYYARHSSSSVSLGTSQGSYAGYSTVTVLYGENGENGRETFNYTTTPKDRGGTGYPYAPVSSYDDLRGLLTDHKTYSSSGKLVEHTANTYNLNNSIGSPNFKWIDGMKVGELRRDVAFGDCSTLPGYGGWSGWDFQSAIYSLYQFWPTLAATTKTTYSNSSNDSTTTTTQITYDTLNLQPLTKQTTSSRGETLLTTYKHPADFAGTAVYDSMVARNIISPVIEEDQYRNSNLSFKTTTDFALWQNNQLVMPKYKNLQVGSNPIETRMQLYGYDNFGNLLEQSKAGDVHEVYLYGYNAEYPVAKITGSNYATVSQLINQSVLDSPSSDAALRTELNKVRTGLAGTKALVTTFTYSPLVGKTSETDPSGHTTYYEYDSLNRLKTIKDQDGNVLKTYDYQYQK